LKDSVITDIPRDMLPELIELAGKVDFNQVIVVGFTPPGYEAGWINNGYPIPDPVRIQQTVAAALADPGSFAADGSSFLPAACGWSGG
jgi:hypothetical protein